MTSFLQNQALALTSLRVPKNLLMCERQHGHLSYCESGMATSLTPILRDSATSHLRRERLACEGSSPAEACIEEFYRYRTSALFSVWREGLVKKKSDFCNPS